ncbi:hypothetical protein Kisp01_30890 [Kineosporia sp. NBRC 101677]|nr:hypothetical protein Kisp01_30890 [Kineosporia sp. NBRC 101677]
MVVRQAGSADPLRVAVPDPVRPPRLAAPFGYLVDLLAAVPSIVYGLWGFYVFRPKIEPFQSWR